MRIILIPARYLPHRGGLENVAYHLAQEFFHQGHQVKIITNRYPRDLPAREMIDGIQVIRLNFLLPDLRYLHDFRIDLWLAGLWYGFITVQTLRRIIKEFKPDIINSHYLNEAAELTERCLANHSPAIPWIISLHGGDVDGEPSRGLVNAARFRKYSKRASKLTACSLFLAAEAEKILPALRGKTVTIHNGVDVKCFSSAKPYPTTVPYILAVGQLVPHKGFDMLINAFALTANDYPSVQLWIAGDGPERDNLTALIHQKGLDERVRLFGMVDEPSIASMMAGCLFGAMPSRREPFGIAALECMAAGKPVLASRVGGIPEFLPTPPNQLVEPDEASWVLAIKKQLALAVKGERLNNTNTREALRWNWPNIARQYLDMYEQVIQHA